MPQRPCRDADDLGDYSPMPASTPTSTTTAATLAGTSGHTANTTQTPLRPRKKRFSRNSSHAPFPKTGLMCHRCRRRIAVLDDPAPDSTLELAMHCPACGNRWVWRDPDGPEEKSLLIGRRKSSPSRLDHLPLVRLSEASRQPPLRRPGATKETRLPWQKLHRQTLIASADSAESAGRGESRSKL